MSTAERLKERRDAAKSDDAAEDYTVVPEVEPPRKPSKEYQGREDYKGFKMPRGMSLPKQRSWKKAIDERTTEKAEELIGERPGALGAKSFGAPGGTLPPPAGDPEFIEPMEGATAGDIARRALEVGSMSPIGQVAQAGADVGITGMDIAAGDYPGAAISAASVLLPFVSAGWLKQALRHGEVPAEAAEKIADLEKRFKAGDVTDELQIRRELASIEDSHGADYQASLVEPESDFFEPLREGPGGGFKGQADRLIRELDELSFSGMRRSGLDMQPQSVLRKRMDDLRARIEQAPPEVREEIFRRARMTSQGINPAPFTETIGQLGLADDIRGGNPLVDYKPPGGGPADLDPEDLAMERHQDFYEGITSDFRGTPRVEPPSRDFTPDQMADLEAEARRRGLSGVDELLDLMEEGGSFRPQKPGGKPPGGGPGGGGPGGVGRSITDQADEIQQELTALSDSGLRERGIIYGGVLDPSVEVDIENAFGEIYDKLAENPEIAEELRRRSAASRGDVIYDWEESFEEINGFDPNEFPLPKGGGPGGGGGVRPLGRPSDDFLDDPQTAKMIDYITTNPSNPEAFEYIENLYASGKLTREQAIQEFDLVAKQKYFDDVVDPDAHPNLVRPETAYDRAQATKWEAFRDAEIAAGRPEPIHPWVPDQYRPEEYDRWLSDVDVEKKGMRSDVDLGDMPPDPDPVATSPKFGLEDMRGKVEGGEFPSAAPVVRDLGPLTLNDVDQLQRGGEKLRGLNEAELRQLRDEYEAYGYDDFESLSHRSDAPLASQDEIDALINQPKFGDADIEDVKEVLRREVAATQQEKAVAPAFRQQEEVVRRRRRTPATRRQRPKKTDE